VVTDPFQVSLSCRTKGAECQPGDAAMEPHTGHGSDDCAIYLTTIL